VVINLNNINRTIIVLSVFVLLIGPINSVIDTVHAEETLVTLVDEGFEDGMPDNWENTGWILNWYGFPHSGSNWISASAVGTGLETPVLTFGENTELSFWYAAEDSDNEMSMEVVIDSTVVWSETFNNTEYQQAIVDLGSYSDDQTVIFNFTGNSSLYVENLDDIVITTYANDSTNETPTGPNDNGDSDAGADIGGGGGGGLPPPENQPPVADVSAGGPYNGIIGEHILFNGSSSSDVDGEIVTWEWDFDDGNTGTGETVLHIFSESGFYMVSLTVTDDEGATNTTIVQSDIGKDSVPPSKPVIKIPDMPLDRNESYSFTVISSDEDGEQIKYVFDWGDGNDNTTDYQLNNTEITRNHSWTSAGRYILTVTATDESNTSSKMATAIVLVDVTVLSIDNENISGVLMDYHRTGEFDVFYNKQTGDELGLQKMDVSTYLIDSTGDGIWDYSYSLSRGLTPYDEESEDKDNGDNDQPDTESESPGFELIVIALALIFILVIKKRFGK